MQTASRVGHTHASHKTHGSKHKHRSKSEKKTHSSAKVRFRKRPKSAEAKEKFLKKCDFIVLIDRSSSMGWLPNDGGTETNWQKVQECMSFIVQAATDFDPDGVDVCFFGTDTHWEKDVESEERVEKIFRNLKPDGVTNLDKALKETFQKHLKMKEEKQVDKMRQRTCVLVITDGSPDNGRNQIEAQDSVISTIKNMTEKLSSKRFFKCKGSTSQSSSELGIRFFQVGNDSGAEKFLKGLDDKLERAKVDIVDTGNIDELEGYDHVVDAFINAFYD